MQVKACSSKVDNLIDKIEDQVRMACGGVCISQVKEPVKNAEELREVCTTESNACYKCLDKCANAGAGAVAVTSFAVFFSLAVASFMM